MKAGGGHRFDPVRGDFERIDSKTEIAPAPKYEEWFERWDGKKYVPATAADVRRYFSDLPGPYGFQVTLAVDRPMYNALAGQPKPDARIERRFVYYRRPVPATLSVVPCGAAPVGLGCAPMEKAPSGSSASLSMMFPQLSGVYSFSIGSGGIFGTREATVKLDANGAPTALEYGSSSGGASIAKVMDSGLAAGGTLRGAQTAANKHKIEEIQSQDTLAELLKPKPTPTATPTTAPGQ